jgi:prephenate dehydrogenase
MRPKSNEFGDRFNITELAPRCLQFVKHIWLKLLGNNAKELQMTEHERILQPILNLQHFAKENQYHGLIEGLSVVFEEFIKEASPNENVRDAALRALKEETSRAI